MSWVTTTLAEVCEQIQYGFTTSAVWDEVGPKFLRITDIAKENIDWSTVPFCAIGDNDLAKFMLNSGDIVIARTGATTGYAKLIRDEQFAVFASYLVRIRVKKDTADPTFIGSLVESNIYKNFVSSQISGSAQGNANARVLTRFSFRLPPLATQQRIASILSAYDDLIENNRKRIALLEQAARLIYDEWFVRLRFPGHESTPVVDGVPEGWEKKKIGDISETVGGGTPSTTRTEYWDAGSIPWVVPSDITKGKSLVLLDTERKITEQGLRHSSAKMLPENAILMTSRASVGYFALADMPVCTNQGFISIIANEARLMPYLLFNLLSRVEEIRLNAKGTTFPEISKTTFRNMDVLIPSESLVDGFQGQIEPLLKQSRVLSQQNVKLAVARDLLLPRLMNGQIEV